MESIRNCVPVVPLESSDFSDSEINAETRSFSTSMVPKVLLFLPLAQRRRLRMDDE